MWKVLLSSADVNAVLEEYGKILDRGEREGTCTGW